MKLVDSNILIYAARPGAEKLRNWIPWDDIGVSVITRIEVLVSDFEGIPDLRIEDPVANA